MKRYSVYCHTNMLNNKKYIGLTGQKPELRWGLDGIKYKNKCPHFWNAIEKYGWNNFSHEIISSNLTREEACNLEKELIALYKTQDNKYGYNILEGGSCPIIPEEIRKKMSKSMKGNKNGFGHPCSEEKKIKISNAQKGRKLSDEHKQKLSCAKKGKPRKPLSSETKKKISNSHKTTPVYCKENNTVYRSIQECARELSLIPTLVCKCCKGKLKSTGGYHLSYYQQHNKSLTTIP